jgi:hypothetical protein
MTSFHETLRFTAHALISPVHAVVGFFAPWEKDHKALPIASTTPRGIASTPTQATTANRSIYRAANQAQFAVDSSAVPAHSCRQVRVLRVMDAAIPASSAGRMVISGRLSEVCAELERLSACS